jgi:hypothetical protein
LSTCLLLITYRHIKQCHKGGVRMFKWAPLLNRWGRRQGLLAHPPPLNVKVKSFRRWPIWRSDSSSGFSTLSRIPGSYSTLVIFWCSVCWLSVVRQSVGWRSVLSRSVVRRSFVRLSVIVRLFVCWSWRWSWNSLLGCLWYVGYGIMFQIAYRPC